MNDNTAISQCETKTHISTGNIKIKSSNQNNIIDFLQLLKNENNYIKLFGKAEKSKEISSISGEETFIFHCPIKLKNNINYAFASPHSKKVNISTLQDLSKKYNLRLQIFCIQYPNNLKQLYEVCQGNYIQWREWRDDIDLLNNQVNISFDPFD